MNKNSPAPSPKRRKIKREVCTEVATIHKPLNIEELLAAAKKVRGKSRAQNNCLLLSAAMLNYFRTGKAEKASSRRATINDYAVLTDIIRREIKQEDGPPQVYYEVRDASIYNPGVLAGAIDASSTGVVQTAHPEDGGIIDVTAPMRTAIDLTPEGALQSCPYTELDDALRTLCATSPTNIIYGTIGLGMSAETADKARAAPGHIIPFYAHAGAGGVEITYFELHSIKGGKGDPIAHSVKELQTKHEYQFGASEFGTVVNFMILS
jgi:hypothetical protein